MKSCPAAPSPPSQAPTAPGTAPALPALGSSCPATGLLGGQAPWGGAVLSRRLACRRLLKQICLTPCLCCQPPPLIQGLAGLGQHRRRHPEGSTALCQGLLPSLPLPHPGPVAAGFTWAGLILPRTPPVLTNSNTEVPPQCEGCLVWGCWKPAAGCKEAVEPSLEAFKPHLGTFLCALPWLMLLWQGCWTP